MIEGQTGQRAYILASGWACSYKSLPGGTRQIVDVQIPGDFLGLRSVLFRTADHNVVPITPVQASEVGQRDLIAAFSQTNRLATAVLWAASRDEAMVVEHLINLGRRDAAERTAHFLLELAARLRLVGLGDKTGFACPLSQNLLADALGLSAVHINRVLRELREAGMVTFHKGKVVFDDYDALVTFMTRWSHSPGSTTPTSITTDRCCPDRGSWLSGPLHGNAPVSGIRASIAS